MRALLILIFCLFYLSNNKAQNATGSLENSKVEWIGKKTGGSHRGTIDIDEVRISYKNNLLNKVDLRIDMQSINCTDLQGKDKVKLESHLKQVSFFNVTNYKYAFFESISIAYDEKGLVKLTGKLKIKNIERDVVFSLSEEKSSIAQLSYSGKVVIDRSEYDLSLSSGGFLESLMDKLVEDDFELYIDVIVNL